MEPFCAFQTATKAVPKERPRSSRYSPTPYTPAKTVKFERLIGWEAKLAMKGKPPTKAVCEVSIVITMKRPKKTKLPLPRGDTDNYVKSILDGMNKIVFVDDVQASPVHAMKQWGEADMITVIVQERLAA